MSDDDDNDGESAASSELEGPGREVGGIVGEESDENDVVVNGRRILGKRYEVQTLVGEGAYGKVLRCCLHDQPDRLVAIKEFKIEDNDPDAEDVKRTAHREASLMTQLKSDHVVQCLDSFLVRDRLCIVMEYMPLTLLDFLESRNGGRGLSSDVIRHLMYQVCKVMTFIHDQGIVYRDIKPENVLMDEDMHLKLCDFGFARPLPAVPSDESITDYVATRWYRAPELLLGPTYTAAGGRRMRVRYGMPVDFWAIGCLMAELVDAEPLFPGESDIDQLYRIQQLLGPLTVEHRLLFEMHPAHQGMSFPITEALTLARRYRGKFDATELDFLTGLLHLDPKKRFQGRTCLRHPYLRDLAAKDESMRHEL